MVSVTEIEENHEEGAHSLSIGRWPLSTLVLPVLSLCLKDTLEVEDLLSR